MCELENRLRDLEAVYREACSENHALRRELAYRATAASSSSSSSSSSSHHHSQHHQHPHHSSSDQGVNGTKGMNGSTSALSASSFMVNGKSRLRLALDGGRGPSDGPLSPRSGGCIGDGSSSLDQSVGASGGSSVKESCHQIDIKREREITVD